MHISKKQQKSDLLFSSNQEIYGIEKRTGYTYNIYPNKIVKFNNNTNNHVRKTYMLIKRQ